jgi:predicted double-glycine peptidase
MKRFRLLSQTRQSTEYSCGACALQSVMSYWGKDVDESELMKLLGTTPEEGSWPEEMVRVARQQGLEAELKSGLTLEEIQQATDQGHPVIVLGQAWRSNPADASPGSVADEWDCGHWFIVLAVDDDYVYFQDPYVRMGKGFAPRKTFEAAWHNVMGGDRSKPVQQHVGIFIRGNQQATSRPLEPSDLAGLESGRFGSLTLLVTRFEGPILPFDFVAELKEVLGTGMVRPDAFIFLRLDAEGLTAVQGGRVEEEGECMTIDALLGVLAGLAEGVDVTREAVESARQNASLGDFGLSATHLKRIAANLQPGESAIIVLFENVWERKFREIAARHRGTVINQRLIGSETLVQLGQELRSAVSAESQQAAHV